MHYTRNLNLDWVRMRKDADRTDELGERKPIDLTKDTNSKREVDGL